MSCKGLRRNALSHPPKKVGAFVNPPVLGALAKQKVNSGHELVFIPHALCALHRLDEPAQELVVKKIGAWIGNIVESMVRALLPMPIILNLAVRVWPLIVEREKP